MREGGREGGSEGGREGGSEGGREGVSEGARKNGTLRYIISIAKVDWFGAPYNNNNNTHIAAIALLPLTTHPRWWAELLTFGPHLLLIKITIRL